MNYIPVNISSLTKLYYSVGAWREYIEKQREDYKGGPLPIWWKLDTLRAKEINIPALTSYLSYAYLIKKQFGQAIPAVLRYDEYINSFLNHIGFYRIAKEKGILAYDERITEGKISIREHFNPAKIIILDGIIENVDYSNERYLYKVKAIALDDRANEIKNKILNLFLEQDLYYINREFINHLSIVSSELAVNSLLHGQSPAFIGLQRIESWSKRKLKIIVCIADIGVGFLESFHKSQPWSSLIGISHNIDAIYNACLMNKEYKPGLQDVIDVVLNQYNGYVNICCMDSEIHWSTNNWNKASLDFDKENYKNRLQLCSKSLDQISFSKSDSYQKGFYRIHNHYIPGTRITFELNIDL